MTGRGREGFCRPRVCWSCHHMGAKFYSGEWINDVTYILTRAVQSRDDRDNIIQGLPSITIMFLEEWEGGDCIS